MSGQRTVQLGDVVAYQTGFPFKSKDYAESGVALLRGDNIAQGTLRWDGAKFWPSSTADVEKFNLRHGDVVLAMDRPWIEAGLKYASVRNADLPSLLVQRVARLRGTEQLDAGFLRYLIGSAEFTAHILNITTGTAVPHISGKDILGFEFALPEMAKQRKIAAILGALDDKIEVNRKASATLEEMARALYRSWFVDFDPVWAKLEGRQPAHMDAATAALFPDSFDNDGLPRGWHFSPMGAVSGQLKQSVKPMDAPNAAFWHYSLPAFDAGASPILENGAAIKSNKLFVPNDAILFSRLNPSTPRVWWARSDIASATPAASTEFYVAIASCLEDTPWLYCLLSSPEFLEQACSRVTGTSNSHQRVPPSALSEIEVIVPKQSVKVAFAGMTSSWFEKIHAMKAESCSLATLRDTLLPRLMSGELRVGEARELVEEVA